MSIPHLQILVRGFLFVWDCKGSDLFLSSKLFSKKIEHFSQKNFGLPGRNYAIVNIINIIATFRDKFINSTLLNEFVGNTH